jgi:hypothetical protein
MSDDLMDRARRAVDRITAPPPNREWVEQRARTIRRRRAASAVVVTVAVALGVVFPLAALHSLRVGPRPAPADTGTRVPEAPTIDFRPADGWHVATTDPALGPDIGWQAWAANVPFAAGESPAQPQNYYSGGYPLKTEKALPPNGILLVAVDLVQTQNALPPRQDFPESSLPLTITEQPSTQFEGQPQDRAMTVLNAMAEGRYVSVRVIFGVADPRRALIDEAQQELDRLVIAPAAAPTSRLNQFGIRMQLPAGWNGVLYRAAGFVPELIASTRPITDLYDGRSIWGSMGPSDVVLILAENDFLATRYEEVGPPIAIGPADACPTCEIMDDGTAPPPGNSLYYRGFAVGGREFDLYVEFGTSPVSGEALDAMNGILGTLEIAPPEVPPPPQPSPSPFPPGPSAAVEADLPPGWTESRDPVPNATNPRIVAAYGTWAFPTGGDCGPESALAELPTDGAFVWIVEYADPWNRGDFIVPPPDFHLDLQQPPARWTCAAGAPSRVELFRIAGRYFEIHVALGQDTLPNTVALVDSLISSLRAGPIT